MVWPLLAAVRPPLAAALGAPSPASFAIGAGG
jgi:hypothetical protein